MTTKQYEVAYATLAIVAMLATLITFMMAFSATVNDNALSVVIYFACACVFACVARYAIHKAGHFAEYKGYKVKPVTKRKTKAMTQSEKQNRIDYCMERAYLHCEIEVTMQCDNCEQSFTDSVSIDYLIREAKDAIEKAKEYGQYGIGENGFVWFDKDARTLNRIALCNACQQKVFADID
jgi:hypothetical protein